MHIFKRLLKKSDFIIIAATSVILIFVTRALPGWINSWMLLQWDITYETGFICRGLAGTLIHLFFDPLFARDIYIVGVINLLLYAAALNFFLMWLYKNNKTTGMFIFVIFFLCSPFVTQWYFTSTMFQRLDVILNILFIISIYIIIKAEKNIALTYVSLGLISILCLLIHDGYAVYSVPTLFGIMLVSVYHKNEKWRLWHPLAFYLAPMVIAYVAILYFGGPKLPLEEYYTLLCSKSPEVAFKLSNVKSIFYMDLKERIDYTFGMMSPHKIVNLLGTVLFMAPSIAVTVCLWVSAFKTAKSKLQGFLIAVLILCTLSTLAAFVLAVDTMRWLGYIAFNNLFALGAVLMIDKSYANAVMPKIENLKYAMIFCIVLAVILGPTQWMDGFEIINKLASFVGFP